ncbi:MAG: aldehyde ferredoxin oxidoreductase family protein [Desulfobacterales bacterium]|nr:aldehyde ferredoxin oxidoreductase family protein [Desulfobacterales bacterium]
MLGYFGKYLRVNLSNRKIEICDLNKDLIKNYMGGAGIAAWFLYKESSPETDPLGPENPLIAFTGPFTGTAVPSASRHHMMARSPLTGLIGESNVGGSWSTHFKKSGYDGIVVTGKADTPVYLWIHDDGVEIRDAQNIWGKDSYMSAEWLKMETSKKATAAVIGQAGEKCVPIAGIPHIGNIVRAAARTGLGAVMGSKNLKAMVAYGTKEISIADTDALKKDIRALMPHIKSVTEAFRKYGTSGGIATYEEIGNFPIKNWAGSRWAGAVKVSGVAMHDTILSGRKACLNCPIMCGRHIKINEGPYAPMDCEGPEYESIGTLGGECMVDDLPAICKANELCNGYGLDTISTGATIAFAMEAFERGIITTGDTDGIKLTFGNANALVEMVHKIGRQEGIGVMVGEGSKRMAEKIGKNSTEFAVHVKGLEPSAHDPRRFFSHAVNYATAARGACHNASWSHPYELSLSMPEIDILEPQDAYQIEGKAEFTAKLQNMNTLFDTLVICRFVQVGKAVNITNTVNWLNMITGREMKIEDVMSVGERVFNLKRLYNTRIGINKKDDLLPPRFLSRNRLGEGLTNQLPPMDQLLNDYYEYRGWNKDGQPTDKTINNLKL